MASVREIKKEIDYLVSEVVFDCYLALHFNHCKKEGILDVMQDAVELRNELFQMANNPAEKHNPTLVKKHYRFIRTHLYDRVEGLFDKLSKAVSMPE